MAFHLPDKFLLYISLSRASFIALSFYRFIGFPTEKSPAHH